MLYIPWLPALTLYKFHDIMITVILLLYKTSLTEECPKQGYVMIYNYSYIYSY